MLDQLTLYQKHYDLILYAFPIVLKYPRDTRFTLGQQTIDCMLDIARMIDLKASQFAIKKSKYQKVIQWIEANA